MICAILLAGCVGLGLTPAKSGHTFSRSRSSGKLEFHEFKSVIFNNSRLLRVLLPPDYYDKKNMGIRYKTLYLNDGQNLFDRTTSIFNPMEWEIDESLKSLSAQYKMEPVIIVGIDNAGKKMRPNEYLPWEDEYLEPPCPDPRGKDYPDFLINEVMPFIKARYRIRPGPANTGLGGSSYGGLIALYAAIKKPGVFGFLLIESPSLYVHKRAILEMARTSTVWPEKIYLGVGTNELGLKNCQQTEGNREPVRDVQELYEILVKAGLSEDSIRLVVEQCALHNEKAWPRRFPNAVLFWLHPKRFRRNPLLSVRDT